MLRPFSLALVLSSCAWIACAIDLEGKIVWNDVCAGIKELGQSKVLLDNGRLSGGIRRDGSFTIPNVGEGSYVLSVISHDYLFDNLRVDVVSSESLPEIKPYIPGTPHFSTSAVSLPYPITLTPRQKYTYFVERETFDLLGMLKNPMMLMMVGTGALMLGMPYLMKNLDPEIAKEVSERQAKMLGIQNSMQSGDIRGGIQALLSTAEEESKAATGGDRKPAAGSASSKGKGAGSRAKRRQ